MSTLSFNNEGILVSDSATQYSITKLETDKYFYVYKLSDGIYAAIVTTIGGIITINTSYLVETVTGISTINTSTCTLTSTKAVIAYDYYKTTYFGKSVVANVSGTVITFGTIYTYLTTTITESKIITYNSTSFILFYSNNSSIYGRICTVSSNTLISFGTAYGIGSGGGRITINNYTTDKWVLTYYSYGSSIYTIKAVVVTKTTTTLAGATQYVIYPNNVGSGGAINSVLFANNTRLAVLHSVVDTYNYSYMTICTLSSNVISVDTNTLIESYNFSSANNNIIQVSDNKLLAIYDDATNSLLKSVILDISGNTVTKTGLTTINNGSVGTTTNKKSLLTTFINTTQFLTIFLDSVNSSYATGIIGTVIDGKKINGVTCTKWNGIAISKYNGV